MNVLWVAQDNKKDGSFIQTKAEVICTASSILLVKHFNPEFKTLFYLDDWTKKYYEQFGILNLFDFVNTTVLNRNYSINYDFFATASKIIALRDVEGPTLNLDLDFFLRSDIKKFGIFDSDIGCLWHEILHEPEIYMKPNRALSLAKIPFELPLDDCAINVSFLYVKNTFFREFYTNHLINYMVEVSKLNNIPKDEWTGLILFTEQYLTQQFAKTLNQKIKVLVDDFYPIGHRNNYIESVGINYKSSGQNFYHFGRHKEKLSDKNYNKLMCKDFYDLSKKILMNKDSIQILDNIYNISLDDKCFKH